MTGTNRLKSKNNVQPAYIYVARVALYGSFIEDSVKGNIALVRRGGCNLSEKAANVAAAGVCNADSNYHTS